MGLTGGAVQQNEINERWGARGVTEGAVHQYELNAVTEDSVQQYEINKRRGASGVTEDSVQQYEINKRRDACLVKKVYVNSIRLMSRGAMVGYKGALGQSGV